MPEVLNYNKLPTDAFSKQKVIPPNSVYIGRDMYKFGLVDVGWGNPFIEGRDGTLVQVLEKYKQMMTGDSWFDDHLHELAEADYLICWCKPADCHGDWLVEKAEEIKKNK